MTKLRENYLLVFLARVDGKLENIFVKTNEAVSKTKADKIGKDIAKENGWRYFSKWPESAPQFNQESSTAEIVYE